MAVKDLHLAAVSEAAAEVLAEEERAPAGDRGAAAAVARRRRKYGARARLCRDGLTSGLRFQRARKHFRPAASRSTLGYFGSSQTAN